MGNPPRIHSVFVSGSIGAVSEHSADPFPRRRSADELDSLDCLSKSMDAEPGMRKRDVLRPCQHARSNYTPECRKRFRRAMDLVEHNEAVLVVIEEKGRVGKFRPVFARLEIEVDGRDSLGDRVGQRCLSDLAGSGMRATAACRTGRPERRGDHGAESS